MAALHDEAAHQMHGCTPQGVYSIPTGRYGSSSLGRGHIPNTVYQDNSSYSPAGSCHLIEIDINDNADIDIDDMDDCSSDQPTSCIFMGASKQMKLTLQAFVKSIQRAVSLKRY